MGAPPLLDGQLPPEYLNYHPQASIRTGLPLPINTFDPEASDALDGDIPGLGSKAALDSYTEGKGRKSVGMLFSSEFITTLPEKHRRRG